MASYCNSGDIARVTFPDGSVQEFQDTPITISCEKGFELCVDYDVIVTFRYTLTRIYGDSYTYTQKTSYYSGNSTKPPIGGIRAVGQDDPPNCELQILQRTPAQSNVGDCNPIWVRYSGQGNTQRFDDFSILKIEPKYPPVDPPLTENIIKIVGDSGAELFKGGFNDCNYSVDCIQGCPPGTIDCGDCCLGCELIFNQISSIRRLLSSLK